MGKVHCVFSAWLHIVHNLRCILHAITETDLSLTLDPFSSNETGEYYAVHNESFRVACIATSNDPYVFVFWKRKDGSYFALILWHVD